MLSILLLSVSIKPSLTFLRSSAHLPISDIIWCVKPLLSGKLIQSDLANGTRAVK